MLQLGYAIDDLQYGFKSIVNNIPQIATSIGGPSGTAIAGAAAIAAVGISQLINHFGKLSDMMQAQWANTSIEQLTTLREKAEEGAAAFEKLINAQTKAQEAGGKGFAEMAAEGPRDAMAKRLADAITGDKLLGTNPILGGKERTEAQRLGLKLMGYVPADELPGDPKGMAAKAEQEARAKDMEKAKELMGQAASGDKQAMLTLAALARRRGDKELEQDIMNLTPEGQERIAQQRLEAQGMRNARKIDQAFDAKAKREGEEERQQWLKEVNEIHKNKRIQALEDERNAVQNDQRNFDEMMWQRQHRSGASDIIQGAKGFVDYIQRGVNDNSKDLQKQAHEQRKITNQKLEEIKKKLDVERGVVLRR